MKNCFITIGQRQIVKGKEHLDAILASLQDGNYYVRIERLARARSNQQNRYYRGVVVAMIAEEIGDDPNRVHEALKLQFLGLTETEGKLPMIISTTSLTTIAMEEYLENIRRWAATFLGISIPEPNEE